jgi:hypothetical protein
LPLYFMCRWWSCSASVVDQTLKSHTTAHWKTVRELNQAPLLSAVVRVLFHLCDIAAKYRGPQTSSSNLPSVATALQWAKARPWCRTCLRFLARHWPQLLSACAECPARPFQIRKKRTPLGGFSASNRARRSLNLVACLSISLTDLVFSGPGYCDNILAARSRSGYRSCFEGFKFFATGLL